MLKLIRGHDKRTPLETLRLDSGDGISVMAGSTGFGTGKKDITFGGLQPGFLSGRRRIQTSRDNGEFSITIRAGQGVARIGQLLRDLSRLSLDAQIYEEEGLGEPVWLVYRATDDLDNVPEPVIGQWSTYMRVLDIAIDNYGDNITTPTARQWGWDIEVKFTTAPTAEGAEQIAGIATGAVKVDPAWGVIVGEGRTDYNKFTNPSFGNSTYTNGWSSSGTDVFFAQETREGFTRSYDSAVLVGAHGGSNVTWTQSIQTTAKDWYVSFYAKRLDGQPVTSADCQAVVNNSARTSYYIPDKDGWYRVFARNAGNTLARTFGVEVKAGYSLVVDDFQLEEYNSTLVTIDADISMPRPFFSGHMAGALWDGTEHAAHTNTSNGSVDYDLGNELSGFYTIAGWFTPTGILPADSEHHALFSFRESSGNYTSVIYELSGSSIVRFVLYKDGSSNNYAVSNVIADMQHQPIHLAVVQNGTNLTLFVNGVFGTSITDDEIRATGGILTLGYGQDTATNRGGWAMDGLRVWAYAMNSSEVAQLYTNERYVKSNGDIIGMPTYAWTHDANGNVENDYDTTNSDYNHMLIGGVSGDLPAATRIELNGMTIRNAPALWIGNKQVSYKYLFDAKGQFWKTGGTTAGGGGRRYAITSASEIMPGKYSVIAYLDNGGSNALETTLQLRSLISDNSDWAGDLIDIDQAAYWGAKSIDVPTTAPDWIDLIGDIEIGYPKGVKSVEVINIEIEDANGTMSGVWTIDEMILIPYPSVRVVFPYNTDQYEDGPNYTDLVINGLEAYGRDGSTQGVNVFHTQCIGDGVTLRPNSYNHLFFLAYDATVFDGSIDNYNPADNWTVTVYVTPRYNLPGGPLA